MPNLYVGNLDLDVTESQLRDAFRTHGAVQTATIFKSHNYVGHAYAVVEMTNDTEAQSAIDALHMTLLGQRLLSIHVEAPCKTLPPRVTQGHYSEPRRAARCDRLHE